MSLKVILVQGGGMGYEQVPAVKRVLQAAGADIEWEEHLAGLAAVEQGQPALSEAMRRGIMSLSRPPLWGCRPC